MDNPRVREEVRRIMGFWLQLGVAGFRVDAVPFILEEPPRSRTKPTIHFEYLKEFREFLQWRVGDAVLLGEANVPPDQTLPYFADGDGLHLMFNFWVNQHLFLSLATEDARPLAAALQATRSLPPTGQWAHFLRNHDELDLGRLPSRAEAGVRRVRSGAVDAALRARDQTPAGTDARRRRPTAPGTQPRPLAPRHARDPLRRRDRDGRRPPAQGPGGDPHADAVVDRAKRRLLEADSLVRPVVSRGPFAYETVNVEQQQRDPGSLLRWTAGMIRVRKQCPEIGWGDWRIVPTGSRNVLAIAYTWRGNTIVCVHNLAHAPREATLKLGGGTLTNLVDVEEIAAAEDGVHRITLEASGQRWLRLGAVNQALGRERVG